MTLRRLGRADDAAFLAIWRDDTVWAALRPGHAFDPTFAAGRFEHHLEHWAVHGFGLWALDVDGQLAGWVGATHPDFVPDLAAEIEIGWTLGRTFRGRGLATEAARAAARAAFEHLGVDRVISLADPSNERSLAVARRLGMERSAVSGGLLVMALARPSG